RDFVPQAGHSIGFRQEGEDTYRPTRTRSGDDGPIGLVARDVLAKGTNVASGCLLYRAHARRRVVPPQILVIGLDPQPPLDSPAWPASTWFLSAFGSQAEYSPNVSAPACRKRISCIVSSP